MPEAEPSDSPRRTEPDTVDLRAPQAAPLRDPLATPPSSAILAALDTGPAPAPEPSNGAGFLGRLRERIASALGGGGAAARTATPTDVILIRVGAGQGATALDALKRVSVKELEREADVLRFLCEPEAFFLAMAVLLDARVELYRLDREPA